MGNFLETLHEIQVKEFDEFDAAEKEAKNKKKGVLIDITDVMAMRPDGHPTRRGEVVDLIIVSAFQTRKFINRFDIIF